MKKSSSSFHRLALSCSLAMALSLCACSKTKEGATQVAAKVNAGEITVHQINFALQNANLATPDQLKQASGQVLNRLVDQELLVQQAKEKKLDRDPGVVQAVEEARREVLARAYLAHLPGVMEKPSSQEIKRYYTQHPELFSDRRIYSLREVLIEKIPGVVKQVSAQLAKSNKLEDLVVWLKDNKIRYAANAVVKPAEQLQFDALARFHAMNDGEIKVVDSAQALAVVQRLATRSEPLDEEHARPVIEQFLSNQRRTEVAEAELKRLRTAAKIEYLGEFAKKAAVPPSGSSTPAPLPTEDNGIEKGIKGLK